MKKTRLDAAEKAVADIHRATRLLAEARRRLARATHADAPAVLVHPQLRWAHRAAREQMARLRRYRGVTGATLGRVMEGGVPTQELCLTVFVTRKLSRDDLRSVGARSLPRSVKVGSRRLRVDVVELGTVELHVLVGTSLGPQTFASEGTIGAFATDLATGRMVAITAMHVTGLDEFPAAVPAPEFVVPSARLNVPTAPLGALLFGTRSGIDAAKIAVAEPQNAASIAPGIGTIPGWRPVTLPGDENASVRLVGAVSGMTRGVLLHADVPLPDLHLDSAILADIPSQPGDSGAPLLDAQNHILGFLVGQASNGLRVFTPASLVMNILQCDIP